MSDKTDKYAYLTGEETLPSDQNRITEQAKFTYSLFGRAFKKEIKKIWRLRKITNWSFKRTFSKYLENNELKMN